jgi:FkbM family methyltransferase
LILDFGANDGSNLSYYLEKAEKVIAIEANPDLCRQMENLFSQEILDGSLVIVNVAIIPHSDNKLCFENERLIDFWINKSNSEISSAIEPKLNPADFYKVEVPALTILEFLRIYVSNKDEILFCKIDIEGLDNLVLHDLFQASIFPKFVSAEAQDMGTFSQLVSSGHYNSFNYRSATDMAHGSILGKFRNGSAKKARYGRAGLFGEDLADGWHDAVETGLIMSLRGYGWNDIHARKIEEGTNPKVPFLLIIHLLSTKIFKTFYQSIFPLAFRRNLFKARQASLIFLRKII